MSHRQHGTYVKYVIEECRCEPCRSANREYKRRRRQNPVPPYVAAGPARAHVRELTEAGVGLKQIAKVSGVSHGALSKLMYGNYRGRGVSKRIRRSTEERILAVTPADAASGSKIPAGATWTLIDEMVDAGVPKVRIATAIGQKGPGLQLSRNLVTARNARAVADLHRRWRTGELELHRHTTRNHLGPTEPAVPPPAERGQADVSDLYFELADIVIERNEQPWRASAACRGRPHQLWFPNRGDNQTIAAGLAVCRACIVRDDCRAANIDRSEGTYGALTAGARRRLRQIEVTAA